MSRGSREVGVAAKVVATLTSCALLSALLGACTGDSEPSGPSSGATAAPTILEISDSTPWLKEGEDFRVVERYPSVIDGRTVYLSGQIAPSTQILVRTSHSPDPSIPEDPRGSAMMTRDSATGETRTFAQHGTAETWLESFGVAIGVHTVVWVETPSRSMYEMPWEMYAYDLDTGTERHIASSDAFGFEHPPWPWLEGIVPHVLDGYVYFPAVDEIPADAPDGFGKASIYRVPVAGGATPELVAKGAIEVFPDTDGMVQIRFPTRLVRWDPSKGPEGEIEGTSLPAPTGSFANEGVRVTSDGETGEVRVDSPVYGRFTIKAGGEGYYLNATSRWVSFTTDTSGDQRGYILDLARGRLMRMKGVVNSSSTRMQGNEYHYTTQSTRPFPKEFRIIALLPED